MMDSPKLNLRPLPPILPTKANLLAETLIHEANQAGAVIICRICHKEIAEVGGLCVGCDHLMGDVQIDQTNRRAT